MIITIIPALIIILIQVPSKFVFIHQIEFIIEDSNGNKVLRDGRIRVYSSENRVFFELILTIEHRNGIQRRGGRVFSPKQLL